MASVPTTKITAMMNSFLAHQSPTKVVTKAAAKRSNASFMSLYVLPFPLTEIVTDSCAGYTMGEKFE